MARRENFIPWEQIEPLLPTCRTADELKAALCRLTGLDPARHVFVTRTYTGVPQATSFWDALRDGLYAEPRSVVGTGGHAWVNADNEVLAQSNPNPGGRDGEA